MTTPVWSQLRKPWVLIAAIAAIFATAGGGWYTMQQLGPRAQPAPTPAPVMPTKVTALGRLEPEDEVITLAAPLSLDGDRLLTLQVQEGQLVQKGQVIGILDARDRLESEREQAQQQLAIAQAKLAQVRAGAKTGEIQASESAIARFQAEAAGTEATQRATLVRLAANLRNAQAEYARFRQLYAEKAISESLMDSKRLAAETAQAELQEAMASRDRLRQTLDAQIQEADATRDRIAEVRPVDIQAAQREVDAAVVAVKRAAIALEQAYLRAPQAGRILKIHTRAGEKLSEKGVVDLAQTHQMVAIAEVYQSDIGKIKLGQPATVTGQAFEGELEGTVSQIGLQVSRQNVFAAQPGENLDRRVVEVKIRLNSAASQKAAKLTNLQVQTAIRVE